MSRSSLEQHHSLLSDSEKTLTTPDINLAAIERQLQRRTLGLTSLISCLLAVAVTLVLQAFLSSPSLAVTDQSTIFLPTLDLTPLGNINRVFEPQGIYRAAPNNHTRDAWLSLFPRGKGYVSMDNIESAGPVAEFVRSQSTDGSGRFCVAAFHQLHCLYLMYEDFYAALDGSLMSPGIHTTHCFDYLRESILCSADTTLEPFKGRFDGGGGGNGVDGFGSVHQCRDFQQVFDWAERFRYNDDTDADRFEG